MIPVLRRHAVSLSTAAVAVFTALSAAGCAAEETGSTTTEQDVQSALEQGILVEATWQKVVTGTPTYGHDAQEPSVAVELLVDDALLGREHPGFDGLERPFVLLPRADDSGSLRWERLELRYGGPARHGYYGEKVRDRYEVVDVRLSDADLDAVLASGLAVGLDTNVGTIWAQHDGQNFVPRRIGY